MVPRRSVEFQISLCTAGYLLVTVVVARTVTVGNCSFLQEALSRPFYKVAAQRPQDVCAVRKHVPIRPRPMAFLV